MPKIHLRVAGVDARDSGQTEHEYCHQSACGYVRDQLTTNPNKVTCYYCRRIIEGKAESPYSK